MTGTGKQPPQPLLSYNFRCTATSCQQLTQEKASWRNYHGEILRYKSTWVSFFRWQTNLKGAWSGHVNRLNFGGHQPYLWNVWSWSGQILYSGKLRQFPAQEWQITLKWGVDSVTWPSLNFGATDDISKKAKARIAIICTHVECIKFKLRMTNHSPKGAWLWSHDPFSILTPSIISPERLKRDSPIFVCR